MFDNTERAIDNFADAVIKQMQINLKTKGFDGQPKGRVKSNTGTLANSLGYSVIKRGTKYILVFKSSVNYAKYVEEGRAKGSKMPPSPQINAWAIQRNLKGTRDSKGRFTPRKSLVYAIRRSISTNGIKPVRFFGIALNEEFEKITSPFQIAMTKDLEDLVFRDFQKNGIKAKIV